MLKETMAVIAAAEKAADNKQAVAEGKAQKIISDANSKAQKIRLDSQRHIEVSRQNLDVTGKREAEKEKLEAQGIAGEQIKRLREQAQSCEKEAVEAVISIILKQE